MEGPQIVMGFLVSLIPLLLSHQSPQRGRGRWEVLWDEEQIHTSQEPSGIWAGGSC